MDNVQGQISEHIFVSNEGYLLIIYINLNNGEPPRKITQTSFMLANLFHWNFELWPN